MPSPIDPSKSRRLGRGLSALLQRPVEIHQQETTQPQSESTNTDLSVSIATPAEGALREIAIDAIEPNKYQPREQFDESSILQLAESIRQAGILQPVLVRPRRAGGSGGVQFELVAGERRWRAAKLAGLVTVPAIVRELSDEDAAEWALVENLQREDLNPMERARAFRALGERFGLSHGQIGEKIGIDRSTVANFIRLTELEPQIQEMIQAGRLNMAHGRTLLAIPPGEQRIALALEALREGWSVRRLERAAAAIAKGSKPGAAHVPTPKAPSIEELERRLGDYLGTKVAITTDATRKRGRVSIEFYGLDHFDGLMQKIGFRSNEG